MAEHESFHDPAEIRHSIGPAGKFSLHNVAGSIRLRGADTDEVHVVARSSHGRTDSLPLVVHRSDGALHIETDERAFPFLGKSWFRGQSGIDFEVSLPRGARVEVNAVSADVDAQALVGEQSYKSVSSDLSIAGGGGRVSLTTVSGDLELTADRPLDANVATTSGDVELSAPSLDGLQLRTVSGDMRVRAAFAVGVQHTVESVSGDLLIEATGGLTVDVKRGLDVATGSGRRLVAGDGSAQLRFRSLSGDVEIEGHTAEAPAPVAADVPADLPSEDSLEILRALERGEIDVEEASRRLEGAASRG